MPSNGNFYIALTMNAFRQYIRYWMGEVHDCYILQSRSLNRVLKTFDLPEFINFLNLSDEDVSITMDYKKVASSTCIFATLPSPFLFISETPAMCTPIHSKFQIFWLHTNFVDRKFGIENVVHGFCYFGHCCWLGYEKSHDDHTMIFNRILLQRTIQNMFSKWMYLDNNLLFCLGS